MRDRPIRSQLLALVAVGVAIAAGAVPVGADQCINDDLIVDGSTCIGLDCICGETFGFDTLRLKENNLRIHFDDTSTALSFPRRDWRITINDSSNGGAEYFAIEDSLTSRHVFRIEAGARSNALYVESDGDIGIGTANPSVDLHVLTGNSPTLRLDQDGSSGFDPQTWDVVGNETNFFVRDVTGGSQLPFRIQPGTASNTLFLASDEEVGIGTSAPESQLHVRDSGAVVFQVESSDNNATQIRMRSNSSNNRRVMARNASNVTESQLIFGDDGAFTFAGETTPGDNVMTIDSSGNVVITGNCSDAPGGGGCTADYVFEPGYELMPLDELAGFIAENKHLPNVPPADETRKNGLNLSAMNGRLLEKVEELTLYTLAQQKEIEELKAQLAALVPAAE